MCQIPTYGDITIPNDFKASGEFIATFCNLLKDYEWEEREIFEVHLALEEAVVNAITHGNGDDNSKCVHVHYKISTQRCLVQIEDEGNGFSPESVPDPTVEENLEVPHGRGLMLMRALMRDVVHNKLGNCVAMFKIRDKIAKGQGQRETVAVP